MSKKIIEWINVKDQLPQPMENCIVAVIAILPSGNQYQTVIYGGAWLEGESDEWWYGDIVYKDIQLDGFDFDPKKNYTVTHWMYELEAPDLDNENRNI